MFWSDHCNAAVFSVTAPFWVRNLPSSFGSKLSNHCLISKDLTMGPIDIPASQVTCWCGHCTNGCSMCGHGNTMSHLENPNVPNVPEVSDFPDVPDIPDVPAVPDVPDVPRQPSATSSTSFTSLSNVLVSFTSSTSPTSSTSSTSWTLYALNLHNVHNVPLQRPH